MISPKKQHTIGLTHALHGLRYALQTQTNFGYQLFIGLIIFTAGIVLGISSFEWLVLILTVFFVLTTELLNSAIEIWVDSGILEANIYAKKVKDIAAAAVIVAVIGASLIGLVIFVPYLLPLIY